MTSCASAGATVCDSGLQECVPPAETCNAQDDNCDGLCDEDGITGCRIVSRSFGGPGHAYHSDENFLVTRGFNVESSNYFYVYTAPFRGMRPMFLCPKDGGRFFSPLALPVNPSCDPPSLKLAFGHPFHYADRSHYTVFTKWTMTITSTQPAQRNGNQCSQIWAMKIGVLLATSGRHLDALTSIQ